jgi:hypothetical protein
MLTAFGSARTNGLSLELFGPARHHSFLLRASVGRHRSNGGAILQHSTVACIQTRVSPRGQFPGTSVDPTDARKATVRRFGRSDRRAQRQTEGNRLRPAARLPSGAECRPAKPGRYPDGASGGNRPPSGLRRRVLIPCPVAPDGSRSNDPEQRPAMAPPCLGLASLADCPAVMQGVRPNRSCARLPSEVRPGSFHGMPDPSRRKLSNRHRDIRPRPPSL